MLNRLQKRKDQSGFTIIEVLIVLAIAGLIMVVVFLAVPALQRSQRNQSRKTDGNNIISLLDDYVSNNGGALPTACTGGAGATPCAFLSTFKPAYFSTLANITYVVPGGTIPSAPDSEHLVVIGGGVCATATSTPTTTSTGRGVAVWYGLEGSVTTQCISQ